MKAIIVNVETNEVIERELSAEELKQQAKDFAAYKEYQTEIEELRVAKNALLEKLGITEEEAKLLLS